VNSSDAAFKAAQPLRGIFVKHVINVQVQIELVVTSFLMGLKNLKGGYIISSSDIWRVLFGDCLNPYERQDGRFTPLVCHPKI